MAALLESQIRDQVAKAFAGKLLTCTLRRVSFSTLDAYGDPVPGADATWTFDGIVDTFNAVFAANAGIPTTDARLLIIAGSLATVPQQDDQMKVRDQWYQLRRLVEQDPAAATYVYAGFAI